MPTDKRLNLRDLLDLFSDTSNTGLRTSVDSVSRRLLELLPGGDPGDITPPGPPTNLLAFGGVTSVTLSWTPPADLDVSRYRVQRSTSSGSGFSTVTETTDTTLLDNGLTGGTTYYYQVAAIDDSGNVGDYSSEASATPSASGGSGTPPTAPGGITAVAGDTIVTLGWAQTDPTALSTRILRSTVSGSGHSVIANGLTGTSFIDTGLTNGTPYYYILRALNANGDVSGDSIEVTATPVAGADVTAPGTPMGLGESTQPTLTVSSTSIIVTWASSPENDLSHYVVYWGTSAGVYTESANVSRSTTTIEKYQLFGLTPSTTYYVTVTAVDTSGNESGEMDEASATSSTTPVSPSAPSAPTNFVGYSTNLGASFTWNANTEGDLAGYRLAAAVQNGGPYVQVKTFAANATSGVLGGLTNGQLYYFRLTAYNTSNQQSNPSTVITVTPAGSTGGGGNTEPPPGGGTGTGGQFSGDTGLGPNHKAPGATFDYVLDASGYTQNASLFAAIGSALNSANTGGTFFNNKRVAVLLPEVDLRVTSPTPDVGGSGSTVGVSFFRGAENWNTLNMRLPFASSAQWHFIGPWPTGTLSDSSATAKAATKKFKFSIIDQDGFAYGGAGIGSGSLVVIGMNDQGATQNPNNRIGFWWCHFNGSGRETMGGSGPSDANVKQNLTLYGCDFKHDHPFRGSNGVPYNTGSDLQNLDALVPRWTVSTYRVGIDQVHYCTFDSPWNYEHHIYERNPPIGDSYTTYTTFSRCGGQIWQETRRTLEGVDLTSGNYAGVHYYINCTGRYWGRGAWSANAFTVYGTHRLIDMQDCTWVNDGNGRVETWPPVNPYAFNISGSEVTISSNSGLFTLSNGTNPSVWPMTVGEWSGWVNPGIKMRGCNVFLNKATDAGIMNLNTCRSVDIEGSALLLKNAGTDRGIWIAYAGWDGAPGPLAMQTLHLSGNNTSALITAFEAANPEIVAVSGSMVSTAFVRYWPPPPLSSGRASNTPTNYGSIATTVNLSNLQ